MQNASLAYHGRAPLPPPIITSPHAPPFNRNNQTNAPPLRCTSPTLSVPVTLAPPPSVSLRRPTSLPPPHVQKNLLQHAHSDRPSSDHLLSQPAHLLPHQPPNAAYRLLGISEHPTESIRPHGHLLVPTPVSNDVMLDLMIAQAIRDAAGFEILNAEAVEVLKKEHDDLADRASDLVPRIAREQKIREGARNILLLYRDNKTASLKAQEELASANMNVDGCAMDLWKITNRRMGLQRKILQHDAAVLARGIRKMEDVLRREGKTANPNSICSVTPDEWEAREDEFQQAFKSACEERDKERKRFEIALEEKDQIIIDMREKMKRLGNSLKQDSKENPNEQDVRELDVSQKQKETSKEQDISKKESVESSVSSTTALDIRTVIQESMREIMMEQNRSEALVETERALRTELEGKIRGLDSEIRQSTETLNAEISRREETEREYLALQAELTLVSERGERGLVLLEEARAKILWFETELEIREGHCVRLGEFEQRAKESEKELERVRAQLENVSLTTGPLTDSSASSTETNDINDDSGNKDEREMEKTKRSIVRSDSMAVEEMSIVLGQLGRTQADLAAVQDYNSRLLNLLKRLDRELPKPHGSDMPAVLSVSSGESPVASTENVAREFTLDGFFQHVQSLAHENRVLLNQVHEAQKRNEIQTEEFSDRASATGKCCEENFETQRVRFEEDRAELSERVRELEKELAQGSETHVEEVRKILAESGRAEEVLYRDTSLLKTQIEELETELFHRRRTVEAFQSDRRALELRVESATVKASTYRNELSEAQLKAFLDATAGLAIDGAEALKREFRRLMHDLRSEYAEQVQAENEERKRLERFVAELRDENEYSVAGLAKGIKTVRTFKISEPVDNSNRENGIRSLHPAIVPPRPPSHYPVSLDSHLAGNFRVHHPNDSSPSTVSTRTSPSFHSVRSTTSERRNPDLGAEEVETNDDENHNGRLPVSYTNPSSFNDTQNPMHRPEGPPVPIPRANLTASPASSVRPGSTRSLPSRNLSALNVSSGHRYPAEGPDDEFGPTPSFPHRTCLAPTPVPFSRFTIPVDSANRPEAFPSHGFHPKGSFSSSESHPYPYSQQQYIQNERYPHRPERSLPPLPHPETGTERGGKGGRKSNRFTFSLSGR